jgi:hypothetical protein
MRKLPGGFPVWFIYFILNKIRLGLIGTGLADRVLLHYRQIKLGDNMGVLAIKIFSGWSMMALVLSLGAAAIIRTGERMRKEELLRTLLVAASDYQSNRLHLG